MTDSTVKVWTPLIFLLLNSVYCQERISVFVGDDILLPCSYKPSPNINVFWYYRDTYKLIDIIGGKLDLSDQDPLFRNRIISFPHLFTKGNFSVVLKNVSLNDAGPYNCDIPDKIHYQQKMELTVTVKPTEQTSTAEPEATSPPSGDSVTVQANISLIFIMMSLILLNTS